MLSRQGTHGTPPAPERGAWGRLGGVIVSNEKKQPIWTAFLRLNGKREFNLCSPIILRLKIGSGLNFIQKVRALSRNKIHPDSLRFFRFTFEFRSNSFGRFSGTGIAALCPP